MVNFLALLGWNPGTEQELFTLTELVHNFDLKRVNKSGARFDPDKTKWFNHHYMQEQKNEDLAKLFKPFVDNKLSDKTKEIKPTKQEIDIAYIALVIGLIKERATFVSNFWELSHYFFQTPTKYDEKATNKAFKEDTKAILTQLINIIQNTKDFSVETLQVEIKSWITKHDISFGKVMMPLRLVLVGALQGPDVFEIMFMIGKTETIKRIENGIAFI